MAVNLVDHKRQMCNWRDYFTRGEREVKSDEGYGVHWISVDWIRFFNIILIKISWKTDFERAEKFNLLLKNEIDSMKVSASRH